MQKVLAQSTITVQEIFEFILVGRARVLKTKADPYRMLFTCEVNVQARKDARRIYSWFKKICESEDVKIINKALRSISSIKRGPHKFVPFK